jgi:deoxyadenosine/deoxycytidine kinase
MSEDDAILFSHIAVEGVLRSGKSRLTEILAKRLGGKAIFDRTDNPYLKEFYEEKEGTAFLAQLVFLVNRYHQQSNLLQRSLFHEKIVCDYLFEKDKIYAYQTLADEELIVYEKIYSIFSEKVAKPDLTIYLQISMPTLMKRIAREGTTWEKNIAEKYLEDVVEAFDYFFFNYQATPLLVVKADELDFRHPEEIEDLIEKIKQVKKSPLFYVPLGRDGKEAKK